MPSELMWLSWSIVLGLVHVLVAAAMGTSQRGLKWNVGNRDGISKPLTGQDRSHLRRAEEVSRRILVEAGARSETIFTTPLRGTHPSGTVRIGRLVDETLQTEVQGLYVCDASVFPEALARPTVLTIIGLGKRLAKHLLK